MRGTVAKKLRKLAKAKYPNLPVVAYTDTPYSNNVPVVEAGQITMKLRQGFHRVMDRCVRNAYQQAKTLYKTGNYRLA